MIKDLDIIRNIMESIHEGDLVEEILLIYFENNKVVLKSNIEQAFIKYNKDKLNEIVRDNFNKYLENKELILSNNRSYSVVKDQAVNNIELAYDGNIPDVVLVPCIGLFSAGGWADEINGMYHIFIALEMHHENMDIILTHEIAHGISEDTWNTVLDGFYREGHAVYVSSVLCPGHDEEEYLMMDKERYVRCLDWMEKNRDKIYEDATKALKVLNEHHKFYFTTGYSVYPNIGYVIGYKYLQYLNKKHTIDELRTFGKQDSKKKSEFMEFIFNGGLQAGSTAGAAQRRGPI
jgi:hypothetical protein